LCLMFILKWAFNSFLQVEFPIISRDTLTGCVSGRVARLQVRFEPPAAVFV
jgi:hypothetical protein